MVSRSGVLLNTVTAMFQFCLSGQVSDVSWLRNPPRSENPDAGRT
jgi:hypothetical protein